MQCGFVAQPRLSEAYIEEFTPEDATECLVTWPIHAVALPITATIDQGARTVESTVPAGRDAIDFFLLDISDDNIMLSRTIAIPKLLATPAIFLGSYIARWFIPIDEEDRPFGEYELEEEQIEADSPPPERQPPQKKPVPPEPDFTGSDANRPVRKPVTKD